MTDEVKSTKAINLKKLRTDINLVIYFEVSYSISSIIKGLKISHIVIYKWIESFDSIFKEILSKYMSKILDLLMNGTLMKLLLKLLIKDIISRF